MAGPAKIMQPLRRTWGNLSLRTKITSLVSLLITLTVLVLTALSIRREQANFYNELGEQAHLLVETLPLMMRDELYRMELDELLDIAHTVSENSNVQNFTVFDRQGRMLVDSSQEALLFSETVDPLGALLLQQPPGEVYMDWRPQELIAGEAIYIAREPIGAVAITLPTHELDDKIISITQQGLALALVTLFIGNGLTLWFSRQITHPLSELASIAGEMAEGDLTLRTRQVGQDEIGRLGQAFNQMAGRIEARDVRLRELSANQERTIAERTAELRRQNTALEELATTDPLTQVNNRRHFFDLAPIEMNRARRSGHPVSVVILDADNFKQINDTYGHQAGDQILVGLVQICKANLRNTDVFARYGGEEFVVLMPETGCEAASQIAERLRSAVAETPVLYQDHSIRLTISLGLACWGGEGALEFDALLAHADQALYQSKQNGRNLVTVWQAPASVN